MNPITRLEIYAGILLVIIFGDLGCYALGRWQGEQKVHNDQLAADAKEMRTILSDGIRLRTADDQGRTAAEASINRVNQGLDNVIAKFSKVPNIVVDARGCAVLGDSFRLRYDAAADLPTGSAFEPARGTSGALSAPAVPPTR